MCRPGHRAIIQRSVFFGRFEKRWQHLYSGPVPLPLYQLEADVFSKIPGMAQLRTAREDPKLRAKYPDAAFALMTAENLFTGDREQCAIHQEAYFSILQGENLKNVRFRYEKEMDAYVKEHMWDD